MKETVDVPNNNVTEVTEDLLKIVADENENRKHLKDSKPIPDCPGTNQASTSCSDTMRDVKQIGLQTLKKVTLIQNILENITNDTMKNKTRSTTDMVSG